MKSETKIKPMFPKELLDATASERLRYFKKEAVVTHSRMEEAATEILEAVGSMCDQNLILLVGPTGVGKTEALRAAVRRAVDERRAEVESKPHIIPAIFVEADAPDRGNFDWRLFYEAGLAELAAPLIGSTLEHRERLVGDKIIETLAPDDHHRAPTTGALRRRFRDTLQRRETALVGVDEAVNLLQVHSSRNEKHRRELLRAAGGSVRSLVNKSAATIVLAGAFDFYELASASAQLARRSHVVYFQEYRDSPEDIREFSRALLGLFAHLPIRHSLDPVELGAELFVQGLGCVGVVKTLLQIALMKALNRGKPLDPNVLRSCYYSKAQLELMRQEMLVGGTKVQDLLKAPEFEEWLAKPAAKPAEDKPRRLAKSSTRRKPFENKPSRRWKDGHASFSGR